jgi:hypothetical protein
VHKNFRKRKFLNLTHAESITTTSLTAIRRMRRLNPSLESSHRVFTPSPNNNPHHRKIYRKMNIRKLLESIPERERDMDRDFDPECKIRAKRGYDRRSGRAVLVFKRSGSGRKKKACGMVDCRICGVFWRKCCSIEQLTECKRADSNQGWISKISRDVYRVSSPSRSFLNRSSPSDRSH